MMRLISSILFALLAISTNGQAVAQAPDLQFVMQLRVTLGEAQRPQEQRVFIPITGGVFEGPRLKGTIIPGGGDSQRLSADGTRTELEAVYDIRTHDGYTIHVRNIGLVINRKKEVLGRPQFYFKAAPRFEAPADSPYAWLNDALYVCSPDFSQQFNGIVLNVWSVEDVRPKLPNSLTSVRNPMLWADVPDPDIIRVGDTYYMVSTTMHLMPGAPVMKSRDLKNWETVGYVFDRLTDSPKYDLQEGTVYGRGQWATSLKYHEGRFWALMAPNEGGDMGRSYIFTADHAEGPWKLHARLSHFHDATLFFDDDGTPYVFYGTGEMVQLNRELTDIVAGSHRHYFQREDDEQGLLEGTRVIKHRGRYYALLISHVFAPGRHRREVCYRADSLNGPWEKQVILEADFGGFPYVGQGTIVDTEEGDWYGIIFQDRGGVGRVLTLMPCRWIDGWPMLGDENGRVPDSVRALKRDEPVRHIVCNDDFSSSQLGLHWQWNHNPVDEAWSLTERPGWLRLKTSRKVDNLYLAPNTLTQRMEGPTCSGRVKLDLSGMRDGDLAGFAAFNDDTGALVVRKKGKRLVLNLAEWSVTLSKQEKVVEKVDERITGSHPLTSTTVWLRIDADFNVGRDIATFYYSLDGTTWTRLGGEYKMHFDFQRFFMGSKFAIFNYATKKPGGWIDADYFEYQH